MSKEILDNETTKEMDGWAEIAFESKIRHELALSEKKELLNFFEQNGGKTEYDGYNIFIKDVDNKEQKTFTSEQLLANIPNVCILYTSNGFDPADERQNEELSKISLADTPIVLSDQHGTFTHLRFFGKHQVESDSSLNEKIYCRFYICPELEQIPDILPKLVDKCKEKNLKLIAKFANTNERNDRMVIYCDKEDYLSQYDALLELKDENPELFKNLGANRLWGKINGSDGIYYGQENPYMRFSSYSEDRARVVGSTASILKTIEKRGFELNDDIVDAIFNLNMLNRRIDTKSWSEYERSNDREDLTKQIDNLLAIIEDPTELAYMDIPEDVDINKFRKMFTGLNYVLPKEDRTKNYELPKSTVAVNIHNPKDDFLADSEIFENRKADSVCRKAKPNDIYEVETYDEVMALSPDYSEPLATRFRINQADFPIFSKQALWFGCVEDKQERVLNIAETASIYVGETIKTINAVKDSDIVIYLDKSARPVSWFVNEFWEEFSDKERPAEANLAIDRMYWFAWAGVPVNAQGELKDNNDKMRKATFSDFLDYTKNLDKAKLRTTFAKIRALFIPGGIESEDAETIMNTPTGLEGKKISIIDEVNNSGSTLSIAQWLIEGALPETVSEETPIKKHVFWQPTSLRSKKDPNMEPQMNISPVWYDPKKHDNWSGRGVLDINTGYFERNYQICPDNYTRAQKYGSIVLGEPMDIREEPGQRSWELQREIREMHEEYRKGHILPNLPGLLSDDIGDRVVDFIESLGVVFAPDTGNPSLDANKYITLSKNLKNQ